MSSVGVEIQELSRQARYSRRRSDDSADIGPIDYSRRNWERYDACKFDLLRYAVEYFPNSTGLRPFSEDHKRVISRMESCVLGGGRYANVVYRGFGKALAVDTPLPTPSGWTTMGDVREGDVLFDELGRQCQVVLATPVMSDRQCFRVHFSDGETVDCCEDHLWTVWDCISKKQKTLPAKELLQSFAYPVGPTRTDLRYSVVVSKPLEIESSQPFLIDPYVLGAWLGDGHTACSQITIGDFDATEMCRNIRNAGESIEGKPSSRCGNAQGYLIGRGHRVTSSRAAAIKKATALVESGASTSLAAVESGLTYRTVAGIKYLGRNKRVASGERAALITRLREISVLGNKHIPVVYLRANRADRLALLQGLMDTDGTISKSGHLSYCTKLTGLRDQVRELLWSLGLKNTVAVKRIKGKDYWCVCFTAYRDLPCFRLTRKLGRMKVQPPRKSPCHARKICLVEAIPSVPVKCIQVDSPSRLYLCGRAMIPTHNTSIAEVTALWATSYGHRKFIPIFGATDTLSKDILKSIKRELSDNELLETDFPEICQAILALEGKWQRCESQTCQGMPTFILWNSDRIVLPSIVDAPSSGAVIAAHGLTSAILGMKHKMPDGTQQRPDFVLIDDPQTAESAKSPGQNASRLDIITRSVLKMAGHRKQLACIVNGTVREPDDMMDVLLDQKRSGAWQSERIPMVKKWADVHDSLWMGNQECPEGNYAAIRRSFNPQMVGDRDRAHREANAFYELHRERMDAGCVVSWEWGYQEDFGDPNVVPEISAIQHAYNMLIDDGEAAFASEMQCQPLRPGQEDSPVCTKEQILSRMVAVPRGAVPLSMERVTGMIDVQGKMLYWLVVAWRDDFTGHILDYGTYPDQKRVYFTLGDAKRTMRQAHPGHGEEGALHEALSVLTKGMLAHDWKRTDGTLLRIERLMIDANYKTDVVKNFIETSEFAGLMTPSHGKYFGANTHLHIADYRLESGEVRRHGVLLTAGKEKRRVRHALIDTNYYKSFVHNRLRTPSGDRGTLTLFRDPNDHRMLIDHLTSETCVTKSGARVVDEWSGTSTSGAVKQKVENHWLDCLVGSAAAAALQGCSLIGTGRVEKPKRIRLSEMQRGKRAVAK